MFSKCSQKKTFLLRTIPRRYPNIKKIRFTQKQWLAVDRTLYKLFDKLDENGDNPLMAGMEGFEPPNGGTRTRCLTTWRHPNGKHNCTIEK